MPKIYNDTDVLTASIKRLEFIFNNFNHICFSVSGGKDSSVMIQLADKVASKMNKTFDVLSIHLEAQYQDTINHLEYLRSNLKSLNKFYWICLPLSLRNAVSVFEPKWECFDPEKNDKWICQPPKDSITLDNNPFPFFFEGMEFEEFTPKFGEWYSEKYDETVAIGVGIRSDESLNRFRTIVNDKKTQYKSKPWTTQLKINNKPQNVYNFYPLYDWRTSDIWGCVSKYDWEYNQVYEKLYKNGVSIHQQRLCQFFGDDQKGSLDQIRVLEPGTWEHALMRLSGVNFGNIYARTSLLGNIKSEKPEHMTWQEYTVFLLESLGLYAPELRDHYYCKIKKFFDWYDKNEGVGISMVPDTADKKLESKKKVASWRRVARAVERNDFWMSRLSFGETKSDVLLLKEMKEKYRTNLIKEENTNSKPLKRVAKELYAE
jgi:predicted phosphoadenosine phosphosulfate sulfurtransferase